MEALKNRRQVMKRIFIVITMLFIAVGHSLAVDQNIMVDDIMNNFPQTIQKVTSVKTIAVYPFEYSEKVKARNMEDKIILKVTQDGIFRVIDRKDIEVLLKEQSLAMAGIIENEQMAELGKLKGADAFLFGKVNIHDNVMELNLVLKEVATGAILWSGEVKGEDHTKMVFGTGVRLGQYSASSWINADASAANLGTRPNDDGIYTAFLFNFVQRVYKSRFVSFGVDAVFSLGLWGINRTEEDLGSGYTITSTIEWRDYNLTLIPVIRIHLAKLLNPKGEDFFIIYGGTGISTDYIQLVVDSDELKQGGSIIATSPVYDSGLEHSPSGFAYKLGFEVVFSPRFSMFFEGYHLPEEIKFYTPVAKLTENVKYNSGNYYGIGARYYFTLF